MSSNEVNALQAEYRNLLHAVQTGVRTQIQLMGTGELSPAGPKHLRVGVNSALIQNSALATLLMDKGIITELEYWETQVRLWRQEVTSYEEILSGIMGKDMKLQ